MGKYYMPAPNMSYVQKILCWARTGERFRPSFPRAVEFQTLSTCNAKCVFCPHSDRPDEIPHGRMDDALFRKIVDETCQHFVGRISPYLTNEPLQDKRMPEMLAYITRKKKFCTKTKINSNASLLTAEIGEALIESGLDQLWLSVNGYSAESYKQSMGLDLDRTLTNIDTFLALKEKKGAKRPKIIVTTIHTALVEKELEYARKYWADRNIVFKIHHMDNRSGSEALNTLRPECAETHFKRDCDLFLKQAYIVENGDMIICCHDWKRTVIVGNVAETSIAEVWNSARFKQCIYDYYAGNFENIEICRNCM